MFPHGNTPVITLHCTTILRCDVLQCVSVVLCGVVRCSVSVSARASASARVSARMSVVWCECECWYECKCECNVVPSDAVPSDGSAVMCKENHACHLDGSACE